MNDPALKTSRRDGLSGRLFSIGLLAFGAAMLVHAALAFAQVVAAPAWLPVLECVLACLAGLWQLRREESVEAEAGDDAAAARPASAASAQVPVPVFRRGSLAPARVAAEEARADRAVVGS
jgi:hypothetical protein